MKAQKIDYGFPVHFDPISEDSCIYRIDDIILEIEDGVLHQAFKVVEKDTPYGEMREVETIEF